MTPPKTDPIGQTAIKETSPAALSCETPQVLTQRRDFQRAARGKRVAMAGFVLQMLHRPEADNTCAATQIRIGYTCSKKVGNAVARNRAKRRLREIARAILPDQGHPGHDYVLIGRRETTAALPFDTLKADMSKALGILHGPRK